MFVIPGNTLRSSVSSLAVTLLALLLLAGVAHAAEGEAAAEVCDPAAEIECVTTEAVVPGAEATGEIVDEDAVEEFALDDGVTIDEGVVADESVVDEAVVADDGAVTEEPAVTSPTPRVDPEPVAPSVPDEPLADPATATQSSEAAAPPLSGEVATSPPPAAPDPIATPPPPAFTAAPTTGADAPPPSAPRLDAASDAVPGSAAAIPPPVVDFRLMAAGNGDAAGVGKFEEGLAVPTVASSTPAFDEIFSSPVDWALPAALAAPADILEFLAAYFVPGSGGSYTGTLAALIQLAFLVLALGLLRPPRAVTPVLELRRAQPAGYRAVVFRPG